MLDDRHIAHGSIESIVKVFILRIIGERGNPFILRSLLPTPVGGLREISPNLRMDALLAKITETRKISPCAIEPRMSRSNPVLGP